MKKGTLRSSLLLFLAATIWGMAFVSQSKGMEYMKPFTFNGVRSLIGAAVLLPVIAFRQRKTAQSEEKQKIPWKITWIGGICCGLALTTATMLQQYGIVYTTVGKAGFITTLYIIFVPILGIFLKRKVPGQVWIAAFMAAIGMYLLCISESISLNPGDVLVFICAIIFSIHILVVDYFAPKTDGVMISCIQFLVCGIICTTLALILEHPTWTQLLSGTVPLLYAGIMSCGVAYTLQIVGQKNLNPTVAALILSLESVVGTLSAYAAYKMGFLMQDQTLSTQQIIGCAVVFAAVVLAQLPFKQKS